jgi:WD40 repeat protein
LLKELETAAQKHTRIKGMFQQIREGVKYESRGHQLPYIQYSLRAQFCFWNCPEPSKVLTVLSDAEGATVFINGKNYGAIQNGKRDIKLPKGPYTVQVEKQLGGRYLVFKTKINLQRNQQLQAPLLEKQPATLRVYPKKNANIQKVSSVAFSPDGRYVLSGGQNQKIWLWDINSSKLRTLSGHSNWISSVSFSPDGRYILSGSRDKTVRLWNVNNGRLLHTYKGHSGLVSSVSFSPDGRYALSGSYDKTMRLWDNNKRRFVRRFKRGSDWFLSVDFSPTDEHYALSGGKHKMRLWDWDTGQLLHRFSGYYFHSVVFLPDGHRVISGSADHTVRLWDVERGKLLHTFNGHSDSVLSVNVSPYGRHIVSGSRDKTVRLWDVNSGSLLHTFEGHEDEVSSVSFSPDGRRILSGGNDGIFLWDAITKEQIARMMVFRDGEWVIVLPDGYFTASAKGGEKLSIWFRGSELSNNASFDHPELVKAKLAGKRRY